jgi:hypothetical protein
MHMKMIFPKMAARTRRAFMAVTVRKRVLALLCTAALLCAYPAVSMAQSDLLISSSSGPPTAAPGGEALIDFTVQNAGIDSTAVSAVTNYVFIWDAANDCPQTQLSPTADHIAFVLRRLGPGDSDYIGPISVFIPHEMPLDTTITIAVVTDWAGLEPESNEDNNMALIPIAIEPAEIILDPAGDCAFDVIDAGHYSDVYQFYGPAGSSVYSEVIAERMGSELDPLLLLEDETNSFVGSEGSTPSLGLDSRLGCVDLPAGASYRLEVFGQDSTLGMYSLCLQLAQPEAEPNDDPVDATPVTVGSAMVGSLDVIGDLDYYAFSGTKGDILILDVDSDETLETPPDSTFDPTVFIVDAVNDTIVENDDTDHYDPYLFFVLPETGDYFIGVTDSPGEGFAGGYPGYSYIFKLSRLEGIALPDLTPLSMAPYPDPVHMDDTVMVTFETWNVGGLSTFGGGVGVDVYLSDDAVIDEAEDMPLAAGDFEGDVDSGNFIPTSVPTYIPTGLSPGTYYLGVVLDPIDDETESNENNNMAVAQVDIETPTGVGHDVLPLAYSLLQNYPNPMTNETCITYHIPGSDGRVPQAERVRIDVFNVVGQRVATLVNETKTSGVYDVMWNGAANGQLLPSGIYLYRMKAGSYIETKRLVILR